jgi:hypothetical protein
MRFLFILLLAIVNSASAQTSEPDPELTSYTWYLGGQWDSLVNHRKDLVRASGQDYFYLRYRIGEAAFRQQKYRIAIDEFQRASILNSADTFSLKYLEAALRETGRAHEAVTIGKKLIQLDAVVLPRYKKTSLNSVNADIGTKISNSNAIGDVKYSSAGVNFLPHPSLALHASFSNIGQSNYSGLVKQLVYSGFVNWQGRKGFSLKSHFSYLDISVSYNDKSQYFLQHQVGGLSAKKSIENWDLDIGVDGGNMNYEDQIQETAGITWFPKSNSKFSLRYQVIAQHQNGELNWIHKPSMQVGIANAVWFGLEYYSGNTRNVIENNGFLLNNSYDKTQSRLIASLNWIPNRHFSAYLSAIHEKRIETLEGFDYTLNGIFFGLKLSPW